MATSLDELKSVLEAENLQPFTDGVDSLILTLVHDGQMLSLHVSVLEDGAALRWRIPYFLKLPQGRRRMPVLMKLVERNMILKFLKFCVDPADGEISVELSWPLMDSALTVEQVRRCLFAFYNTSMDERTALMALQRTGVYPQDTPDQVEQSVRRLFEASGADDGPGDDEPPDPCADGQCSIEDLLDETGLEGDDMAASTRFEEEEDL